MSTQKIIQKWMDDSSQTLANYDIEGHLNLISKKVNVFGVPDFEVVNYKDWAEQVRREFADKSIKSVLFKGLKVGTEKEGEVMFTTIENITATDGTVVKNRLEVVLSREDDGQWRVLQERILDDLEFAQDHFNMRTSHN